MDDLISRQAAIDALKAKKDKSAKGDIGCFYNTIIQNTIDAIKDLPSAQPEQKTATFYVDSEGYERCSVCNEHESGMRYFNFCPNCGAKMEGTK